MSSLPTPPRLGPSLSSPPDAPCEPGAIVPGEAEGLKPGDVLDGRYEIEGQIGEGGVGAVYRARQLKLHRRVAVKLLLQDVIGEEALRPRFEQEALTLAALSHPNIVNMQDYGIANGRPYLVMELLEGRTLREILDSDGPLEPARALLFMRQVVLALAYAHELGIVHRDLKPANMIVQAFPAYEHVKVLDFGMVKLMPGSYLDRGAQLTRIGFTFGTPAYMSPEHALGGDVDGRSDLYSAGVLLFEMLTGKKPYEGEVHDILRHHLASPVPSLAALRPELGDVPELQQLIDQAMAKERDERFADATDLLRVMDELLMSGLLTDDASEDEPAEEAGAHASFVSHMREALGRAASALAGAARAGRERSKRALARATEAMRQGRASPRLMRARRELRELAVRLTPALRGLPRAAWSRVGRPFALAARRVQRLAHEARARLVPLKWTRQQRDKGVALPAPGIPSMDRREGRSRVASYQGEADATIVDEPRDYAALYGEGAAPRAEGTRASAEDAEDAEQGEPEESERAKSASDTADPLLLEPRESVEVRNSANARVHAQESKLPREP